MAKRMKANNATVKGNKILGIGSRLNAKGFFKDMFGNKIYKTDSKENQERLEKLKKKPAKKKTTTKIKKETKKSTTKKKG